MTVILKTIKRVIVALNFPAAIAAFIVFAKAIYKAMLNNSYFTSSAAKLASLNTNLIALDSAQTACNTKPPTGSTEARNAAWELVKADLRSLRSDVQAAADANPAKARTIITSAAMGIRKDTSPKKQQNIAKNNVEEGCVDLVGAGRGPHEWRWSTDDKTWTFLPASITAKTTVSGLESGSVYFFQNRQMLPKDVKGEWSQSVKIRVK